MKNYPTSSLRPGMAFSKAVYIDKENVLLKPNEVLSDADIERLKKWKIEEVFSDGELVTQPKTKKEGISAAEETEIAQLEKELKSLVKGKGELEEYLTNGEELLKDAYEHLANETAVQLSPIRNLAENLVTLIEKYPSLVVFASEYNKNLNIYRHALMTALYGVLIAEGLSYSTPKTIETVFSILLMDVGMKKIPPEILIREGSLSESDRKQLQTHPLVGYKLLTQVAKIKNQIAIVALEHQEHFDGSGYPRKIRGENMSDASRIASIADSYCAILENKNYRKSRTPYEAMKELVSLGIYRYDPQYLKAFLNRLSIYPIGSLVTLSDDTLGVVVAPSENKPMRPVILILRNKENRKPLDNQYVSLLHHTDKYIVSSVSPEKVGINFAAELIDSFERIST